MSALNFIEIPSFLTRSGYQANLELSYQTFGPVLGTAPIVLIIHALTGNSNVSGENGWWNDIVGAQKTIDTDHFTVLAFNLPGNGFENTAEHLIFNYKEFVAFDIAKAIKLALDQLNITNLHALLGASVGGGVAWELVAHAPDITKHFIPIAADYKSTDWIIANCHIQDAILSNSNQPLVDARKHAMTLYRTPESLTSKFNREGHQAHEYEIERWLNYHGIKLNERFCISAYKMMNQVLKTIDIELQGDDIRELVKQITATITIVTVNSDLFFKPEENWNTYVRLKKVKDHVYINEIESIHGHDAFLIEYQQLKRILDPIFNLKNEQNESSSSHILWSR